jgi:D-glycero-alpha-D-manno-heptose-7-phosphate kinase
MIYSSQSPTRVDLAGGTLDLWPFYCFLGEAVTLNVPISVLTQARLEVLPTPEIYIESPDVGVNSRWADLNSLFADSDPRLKLFQDIVASVKPFYGFKLFSQSHSPVGGGLGGSSSLTMSILKAFFQANGHSWDPWGLIELAHNIEAKVLKKPTGTQDYVTAVTPPGVNAIHYGMERVRLETLTLNKQEFQSRFTLVYTGRSHNSGINNWDVQKQLIDGDAAMEVCLRDLKAISDEMYALLKSPKPSLWDSELPRLFKAETRARQALSEGFSSPEIKQLEEIVLRAGGHAVKICGAGGGGCVMIWSPPDRKTRVEDACRSVRQAQVLEAEPLL